MLSIRPIARAFGTRGFRTISPVMFEVGDKIPTGIPGLQEGAPSNKVDLGKEVAKGKNIIVGVPAAFSPACTATHVPGYIEHLQDFKKKGFNQVFVTAVNDAFVTKAWSDSLHCPADVHIIADTQGEFARAGATLFDSKAIFGNDRSIRYALVVDNGEVVKAFAEPDKTGVNVSSAENVLKSLD